MKKFCIAIIALSLVSCSATKKSAAKKQEAIQQAALAESLQQKQLAGIDFYAKGSTPSSWTLEIDFDKIIRFQSLDGTDYKSSPVAVVENEAKNTSTFTTKAGKGNMIISLYKEACTDALSGEKFNKKVTVDVDGKRYEGCGQYLVDASLNGKWIMEKISGKTVTASEFAKGLPTLNFELASGKISGHDGCNTIKGNMEVMGNRIKFSPLASTKMACPANKKDNEITYKLSNNYASYFFADGLLHLYLIDDSVVSFRRTTDN